MFFTRYTCTLPSSSISYYTVSLEFALGTRHGQRAQRRPGNSDVTTIYQTDVWTQHYRIVYLKFLETFLVLYVTEI